jgi:hypothetical protein
VSFERAHGFAFGLALAGAALEVGAGALVVDGAVERDRVEGVVGLAVAAAVEAVANGLAGASGLWCGAVAAGEGGLALEPAGVAGDQLGGGDRSDPGLLEQRRVERTDQAGELGLVGVGLGCEFARATGEIS